MLDTASAFGLLFASLFGGGDRDTVWRRTNVETPHGVVLWGVGVSRIRHLAVPIASDYAVEPRVGESLEVRVMENLGGDGTGRFLDLRCMDDRLKDVFASLCDDVLERVEESPDRAASIVLATLDEWRRLLASARVVTEESARGLFGELVVLLRLARINPEFAMSIWTGPSGANHDFESSRGALEVKTSEKDSMEIVVSSLEQLDPGLSGRLCLLRVRVTSAAQGQTIDDLIGELAGLGCSENDLYTKVAKVGFVGPETQQHKFEVINQDQRAWMVGPDFPGIKASDLPEIRRDPISRIRYQLSLVGAPGLLNDQQLEEYLADLVTA